MPAPPPVRTRSRTACVLTRRRSFSAVTAEGAAWGVASLAWPTAPGRRRRCRRRCDGVPMTFCAAGRYRLEPAADDSRALATPLIETLCLARPLANVACWRRPVSPLPVPPVARFHRRLIVLVTNATAACDECDARLDRNQ